MLAIERNMSNERKYRFASGSEPKAHRTGTDGNPTQSGIKGLTVKNLSQKAGINRGTFYLHYKDIYDLIEQSEWMRGLLEIFEPIQLGHLFNHSDERSPFPAFAEAFRFLQHHSSFFKAIFHSSVPIEFRERLQYLVGTRMYESLKQDHPQSSWSDQPAGYIIAYLGTGQFGLFSIGS